MENFLKFLFFSLSISFSLTLKIKTGQISNLGFERTLPQPNPNNTLNIPTTPQTNLPIPMNTSEQNPPTDENPLPRPFPRNTTLNPIPSDSFNSNNFTSGESEPDSPRFIRLPANTTNTTSNPVTSSTPSSGGLMEDLISLEALSNLPGNTSEQIMSPLFLREYSPLNEMRIIPSNFWFNSTKPNITKDFVMLRTKDNMALSCLLSGLVYLSNFDETDSNEYWIPEIIGENVLRLRSFNGGYLEYDPSYKRFICSNNFRNFKNLLNVFLSSRNGLCLLLKGPETRFISHSSEKLIYQNLTRTLDEFCFFGDEKKRIDPSKYYGYALNITDFIGRIPSEEQTDEQRGPMIGEEAPLNRRRPRSPLGNTTATITNITRERELNYSNELFNRLGIDGDLHP